VVLWERGYVKDWSGKRGCEYNSHQQLIIIIKYFIVNVKNILLHMWKEKEIERHHNFLISSRRNDNLPLVVSVNIFIFDGQDKETWYDILIIFCLKLMFHTLKRYD